ncbi:unnamed protein product [Phytophthora fragariaefolia]|uniref:Unnamed protein product n=1 Tax=Phytophthora fragariaefolia TaxID=1490495 RepID=A0A9W6U0G2_9STRA|nr:unnamed protein product [Phytophthora fragariaefolia]
MSRKHAPPQSQPNGERKRRRSRQGTADNSAHTVKLASTLNFHGVWRELKAAGRTSKPPRGLDNRFRYVLQVVPPTVKLARITCKEEAVLDGHRANLCSVRFDVYVGDGQNGGCTVDGATTQTLLPSSINKRGVPGANGEHHQAARGDACSGVGVGDGAYIVGCVCRRVKRPKNGCVLQVMWVDTQFQNAVESLTVAAIKRGIENYQALVCVLNKPTWRNLTDTVVDEELNLDWSFDELEIVSDEEGYERYDPEVFLAASLAEVEAVKNMRLTFTWK